MLAAAAFPALTKEATVSATVFGIVSSTPGIGNCRFFMISANRQAAYFSLFALHLIAFLTASTISPGVNGLAT